MQSTERFGIAAECIGNHYDKDGHGYDQCSRTVFRYVLRMLDCVPW